MLEKTETEVVSFVFVFLAGNDAAGSHWVFLVFPFADILATGDI